MKAILNKNIVLHTDLSIDECKERLYKLIDTRSRWISMSLNPIALLLGNEQKQFRGKIIENRVELEKRKYYQNDYAPIFIGRFIENSNSSGVSIEGEYKIPIISKVLNYYGKTFFLVFFLLTLYFIFHEIKSKNYFKGCDSEVFSILIGILFFFIVFDIFVRWLARKEKKLIIEFLGKTLDAKVENQVDQGVLA